MSLFGAFRGFFGFPEDRRPRDPFFGGITRDDDDDEEDEDSFGAGRPGDFGFGFTFGPGGMRFHDTFGFDELFQDFNNIFQEMGARSLPSGPFDFPGAEPPAPSLEKRQTLRDFMLKHPDSQRSRSRALEDDSGPTAPARRPWQPFHGLRDTDPPLPDMKDTPKEDRDLDSQVTSKGLETILPPTQPRSYFKSVSITKVVAPDGTVEERRTVRDSQGHEETVVTRQSGREPRLGLDGGQQGGSGDLAPFSSRPGEDLGDTASVLGTFFRRWFPSR